MFHHRAAQAAAAVLLALTPLASGEPADGQYELVLGKALPGEKALTLHLDVQGGKVVTAFGTARTYNGRAHDVDAVKLTIADGAITGTVGATINADPWVPKDGKPRACTFDLDVKIQDGAAAGTYKGTCAAEARSGAVTGAKLPAAAPQGRYRIKCFQAMRRLAPARGFTGSNADYALDMWLSFRIDAGGRAVDALFESPVPDYRRYSAIVKSINVKRRACRLTAEAVIDVDHGEQGRAGGDTRCEQYTYTLHAMTIGDWVVGRYDARVKELDDRGIPFLGAIDRSDPPAPDAAIGFLRLHGAMKGRCPVLLYLSLTDGDKIHGMAYAPGYNHQPQAVDASRLKRKAGQIEGKVTVSIYPDCYHDQDVFFDIHHDVKARIERDVIVGRFKGSDRGETFEGPITGELRPKAPPAATLANLAVCELNLGYAMPQSANQQAAVRLAYSGGKLRRADVIHPRGGDVLPAKVERAEVAIDGDRLTGSCAFDLDARSAGAGRYEYTFAATINGVHLGGYWRGKHNGRNILTKSAKLSGTLTPTE